MGLKVEVSVRKECLDSKVEVSSKMKGRGQCEKKVPGYSKVEVSIKIKGARIPRSWSVSK